MPSEDIEEDIPDPFADLLLARAMAVVSVDTDVSQVRAGMAEGRNDPDMKAEYSARAEQLDIDMAMLMALTDDTLEHHQAGKVDRVIIDATRTVRFALDITTDQKRAAQIIMRLSRLLYMELVDKVSGDREALMEAVAKRAEGGRTAGFSSLFARDLLGDFKLDR